MQNIKSTEKQTLINEIKMTDPNTFKKGKALLSFEEAVQVIQSVIEPLPKLEEEISSENSLGRRLAEDIYAHEDLPKFRKSTMDGYAICGEVVESPQGYQIIGQSLMGKRFNDTLNIGQAVYVPTGSELPSGTTAIVKIEGCKVENDHMFVIESSHVGPHWINKGEDIEAGQRALTAGSLIGPMSLGFLSLMGKQRVKVKKKLKIAILTTGDELVPSFEAAPEGKIRDINQAVLKALAVQNECEVVYAKQLPDVKAVLKSEILEGNRRADLVITCGASSMGKMDVIPEILEEISDGGLIFHGLNLKPGKPVGLALISGKPILALPGNPVSSAMTFVVIAEPLIGRLLGREIIRNKISGNLQSACASQEGKATFVPVKVQRLERECRVIPNIGKSGLISIIADADGFIHLKPNQVLDSGSEVEVTLF